MMPASFGWMIVDMRRMFAAACTLLLAMIVTAVPAHAWGPVGHRLVAHLAAAELDPATKREVARLLRDEQEPSLAAHYRHRQRRTTGLH